MRRNVNSSFRAPKKVSFDARFPEEPHRSIKSQNGLKLTQAEFEAKQKKLQCEEVLDDTQFDDIQLEGGEEELEATQRINVSDEDNCEEDELSSSSDDESDFRSHCSQVMKEHGLEVARTWFQLEARHFKKPKIEKKQKQL
nr:MAG: hypothetical protein [Cressdnaviricota sp.]